MKTTTRSLGILLCFLLVLAACNRTVTQTLNPDPATETPLPPPTEPPPTPDPTATPTTEPVATSEMTEEPTETAVETPTGNAVLSGQVWHDICATSQDDSGSVTDAGPGCVVVDEEYRANGVKEPRETGLEGLTVSLSMGTCAEAPFRSAATDQDGNFVFDQLPGGAYCVRLDPAANAAALGEGLWTSGPDAGEGVSIELVEGEQRADLSFGWDFADFPQLGGEACTEKAGFSSDVTIPDNTLFRPGDTFEKIWRIKNEGSCTWGPGYQLIFVNGDALGAQGPVSFPSVVPPGAFVDLSVAMQAPSGGGTYRSNWQFRDPGGRQFGIGLPATSYLWTIIKVTYIDTGGNPAPPPPPSGGGSGSPGCPVTNDPSVESQVLSLLNAQRAAAGLPALVLNAKLTAAARAHSTDMSCNDFIDHTGSDGSLWYGRIAAQGYSYAYASENIYVGNPAFGGTAQGAVTWWMNSQVHRDNILSQAVSEIGVGYIYNENSTYGGYFTLVFARP